MLASDSHGKQRVSSCCILLSQHCHRDDMKPVCLCAAKLASPCVHQAEGDIFPKSDQVGHPLDLARLSNCWLLKTVHCFVRSSAGSSHTSSPAAMWASGLTLDLLLECHEHCVNTKAMELQHSSAAWMLPWSDAGWASQHVRCCAMKSKVRLH